MQFQTKLITKFSATLNLIILLFYCFFFTIKGAEGHTGASRSYNTDKAEKMIEVDQTNDVEKTIVSDGTTGDVTNPFDEMNVEDTTNNDDSSTLKKPNERNDFSIADDEVKEASDVNIEGVQPDFFDGRDQQHFDDDADFREVEDEEGINDASISSAGNRNQVNNQ